MTKDHDNSKGSAERLNPTFLKQNAADASSPHSASNEIAEPTLKAEADEFYKLARFAATFFRSTSPLTSKEARSCLLGMDLMARMWVGGTAMQVFDLDDVLGRGRCLLLALALHEALHKLGRKDAVLLRTGLNVSCYSYGEIYDACTVGHPYAAPSPFWNAHMTVGLGNLIFDPTLCQMRVVCPELPYVGVYKRHDGKRPLFDLHDYGQVEAIASDTWGSDAHSYAVCLFTLPRPVDLSTRKWHKRPDASQERRADLVQLVLELIEQYPLPLFTGEHD